MPRTMQTWVRYRSQRPHHLARWFGVFALGAVCLCRLTPPPLMSALTLCMDPGLLPPPDGGLLADAARAAADSGLVDPVSNLADAKMCGQGAMGRKGWGVGLVSLFMGSIGGCVVRVRGCVFDHPPTPEPALSLSLHFLASHSTASCTLAGWTLLLSGRWSMPRKFPCCQWAYMAPHPPFQASSNASQHTHTPASPCGRVGVDFCVGPLVLGLCVQCCILPPVGVSGRRGQRHQWYVPRTCWVERRRGAAVGCSRVSLCAWGVGLSR